MIFDNFSCDDSLYASMYYTKNADGAYSLTLHITGTGEMTSIPWSTYNKKIAIVTVLSNDDEGETPLRRRLRPLHSV